MGIELSKLLSANGLRREKKRVLLRRGFLSGRPRNLGREISESLPSQPEKVNRPVPFGADFVIYNSGRIGLLVEAKLAYLNNRLGNLPGPFERRGPSQETALFHAPVNRT